MLLGVNGVQCSGVRSPPSAEISLWLDSVGSATKPAMALGPFTCSTPRARPTYPHRTFPDIFGHFLPGTGELREKGIAALDGERRLDGGGMRVRGGTFHAAGGTNSALFGMSSALFCSFLYEFCFILYVYCFVFWEKPRYSAGNGVSGTGKWAPEGLFLAQDTVWPRDK
jgi:hypothetical protein